MLEILQFYVSGFWVWAGITFGLVIICTAFTDFAASFVRGFRRERDK